MIARVTIAEGRPEEIGETIQFFETIGLPSCLEVSGFKAAYLLVDRAMGKWVELSLWESKAADEAAMAAGARRLEGRNEAQVIGARIHAGVISSEYYEVVAGAAEQSD